MSKTLQQIFTTNPITSNLPNDLMYFVQSPYTPGTDAGMTYANFSAQFGAPFTPAALTRVNDTNVTVTLGGTPGTALLQATSLTLGWSGQLSVSRGGTGLASITSHDLIIGNGTSAVNLLAPSATSGVPLISQGASADPVYGTAVVAGGGTGNTTFTAYSVICAGTTATGAFQNVSGLGSSGQTLTSNGAGALPTWQTTTITGQALTKIDDTNVTLTLGGSPTTALVNASSLTLGWTGTLSGTRGGTGVNNGASTITVGGNFAMSGAFTFTGTLTNTTAVTFPTSGTLATTSQIPTGAALTKTDDTNVTLTLGGSPTTALVNAASLTLGWTGQLGLTRGGTAASLTASNGGIVYSTASALAILAGTSTANQILMSGASTTPAWSTATYPATTTINQLLYSSSANTIVGLATANSSVLVTSSGGVPSLSTTLPNFTTDTITFNPTTHGLKGTTTNDAAAATYVGESISSQILFASATSLTNTTPKNVTSITLTAGDWLVWGNVYFNASVTGTAFLAGQSNTSATFLDNSLVGQFNITTAVCSVTIPIARWQVSGSTIIYLVAESVFASGTMTACGTLQADRLR